MCRPEEGVQGLLRDLDLHDLLVDGVNEGDAAVRRQGRPALDLRNVETLSNSHIKIYTSNLKFPAEVLENKINPRCGCLRYLEELCVGAEGGRRGDDVVGGAVEQPNVQQVHTHPGYQHQQVVVWGEGGR